MTVPVCVGCGHSELLHYPEWRSLQDVDAPPCQAFFCGCRPYEAPLLVLRPAAADGGSGG